MEVVGQEINVIIDFQPESTSSYTISTKETKSLLEQDYLKLLRTGVLDIATELQCHKCCQTLQLNLFWTTESHVKEIKEEPNLDDETKDVIEIPPLFEKDENEFISEPEEHPCDSSDSEVAIKKPRRIKKVSRQVPNENAIRRNKCRSSTFDPDRQVWHLKWLNGETTTTNFDLGRNICDICGKPKGRRSVSEFLKHRASHFMGRKISSQGCIHYCVACDTLFQESEELEFHSRMCEQKSRLVEQVAAKDSSPKLHKYVPEGVILPKLPNKKEGYFLEVPQSNGTIAYVEHLPDSKYTHVTNFNPRNRQCDICRQPTKDAKSLRAHRKFHFFQLTNDERCVGCGETFATVDKRTQHTLYCKKKDKINPNACIHCHHTARNFTKLRFHISAKHGPSKDYHKPSVLCHLCSQTVLKEHLENHLRRHATSDGKAYECDHCAKRFSSVSGIKEHLTRLHFPHLANYRCHLCDFGSRTEHVFKLHLSNKHEIGKEHASGLPCSICNQVLKTPGSLRQHMVNFHMNPKEKRKFTCEICNKSFFSKYNLEKHSYIHKPDHEKPFRCKHCKKGFGDKHKYSQHLQSHDSNAGNLFCCPTCGKGMKYKQSLETHMRMHTGEQPYECQVCNKKFADRGNYRQHMKQHEKALSIKLTYTAEERRLMKLKLLEPQQLIGLDM